MHWSRARFLSTASLLRSADFLRMSTGAAAAAVTRRLIIAFFIVAAQKLLVAIVGDCSWFMLEQKDCWVVINSFASLA